MLADLAGAPLRATLQGAVELVKLSERELTRAAPANRFEIERLAAHVAVAPVGAAQPPEGPW